jgi:L-aspartate oxidase
MRIRELIAWGAEFDREGPKLAFTQEAAHTKKRILHAHGDSTGREILRTLSDKVRAAGTVRKLDYAFTIDLRVHQGRCIGATILERRQNRVLTVSARAVVLATGGAGRLYERTTNPAVATGDGMAMAFRAGATLLDMEFVQFHPTALFKDGAPQFLLSEAMRGEGGMLRNINGRRFMEDYHPARELAPRDVVTRAIHSEMIATHSDHILLDMTHLNADYVKNRFPRIFATCLQYGVDITSAPVPVSPAAHYIMGGVRTDLWGKTTLPGLFAAGETACTGVHGANRLASNSLLEGLVFGERAGLAAAQYASRRPAPKDGDGTRRRDLATPQAAAMTSPELAGIRGSLKKLMWEKAGIVRDRKGLAAAVKQLAAWDRKLRRIPLDRDHLELRNMVAVSLLIARSALQRDNSVGAHFRSDYPVKGRNWRKRIVLAL